MEGVKQAVELIPMKDTKNIFDMSCIDKNYFKLEFKLYGVSIIKAHMEGYFVN